MTKFAIVNHQYTHNLNPSEPRARIEVVMSAPNTPVIFNTLEDARAYLPKLVSHYKEGYSADLDWSRWNAFRKNCQLITVKYYDDMKFGVWNGSGEVERTSVEVIA